MDAENLKVLAEIRGTLDLFAIPEDVKLRILLGALETASNIAIVQTRGQAGGEFFKMLLELLKFFLPILLELLRPKP